MDGDDARRVRLSEAQLRATFLSARVGYSVIELVAPDDPETWVIRANNRAASLNSQADLAPVVGQRLLEAFPPMRDSPFIGWYQKVHRTGQPQELPEIRYGDEQVPDAAFRVWLDPMPGDCVLGQYVNVTLQRQAEGRLRALNASLEAQVAARTAALTASRRMLGEITYAAAHDLQTPLRHVLLLSDPDEPFDEAEPVGAPLALIHRAAMRMRERLSALLVYTGADRVEPARPVDLRAELDRVLAGHARLIDASAGRVRTALDPGAVSVPINALRTALEQLVENALIFHAPGAPPEVTVKLAAEGPWLALTVRDEGLGIAPEHHAAIFQAFYRVHGGDRFPGVGVGLAAVRVATEAAGGRVEVRSAPGEGATFTVRLPLAEGE